MRWAVVVLLLGACPRPSYHPIVREVPYDVAGKFTDDAYRAILAGGPLVDGEHQAAATRYVFVPRPQFMAVWSDEEDGCACTQSVREVRVELAVTVTFPRWTGYGQALPLCQAAWDSYQKDLRRHEARHAEISLRFRPLWERRLRGAAYTAYAPSCAEACGNALHGLLFDIDRINAGAALDHRAAQAGFDAADAHEVFLRRCSKDLPEEKLVHPRERTPIRQ